MSKDGIKFGQWSIPPSELEESFDTSGGPGGQHANRNKTAVTIRFDIAHSSLPESVRDNLIRHLGKSAIETHSSESRSQWRNRATARHRLTAILEDASRTAKARRRTRPSRASKDKRLHEKRRKSEIKEQRKRPTTGD
ncbi:MAG TPA: alternative ribosome rescue aminoacyl-tRNA hydrolase ArfB [Acidimicrobiia bacterium]